MMCAVHALCIRDMKERKKNNVGALKELSGAFKQTDEGLRVWSLYLISKSDLSRFTLRTQKKVHKKKARFVPASFQGSVSEVSLVIPPLATLDTIQNDIKHMENIGERKEVRE